MNGRDLADTLRLLAILKSPRLRPLSGVRPKP